ncbi:MAG: segregation/condensation protein A [Oscillospiraceae bacterium]
MLQFKLEVFEGPLDLLLHLISKHKLNIYDIQITTLLEQYMQYLDGITDLEQSSEFLAMAARLVYIKTLSLLPKPNEMEELKKELEGQLLEYQTVKAISAILAQNYKGMSIFVRNPMVINLKKTYSKEHSTQELLSAYMLSIGKSKRRLPPPKTAFTGIVSKRIVSVETGILRVLKKLYKNGKAFYSDFFIGSEDKSEMVAIFLAMLELIKSKRIVMDDENQTLIFNKNSKNTNEEIIVT